MGWAQRASRKELAAWQKQRASYLLVQERLDAIKARIAAGEALTDADHRIIARCGPETLAYIGYNPRVTLQ